MKTLDIDSVYDMLEDAWHNYCFDPLTKKYLKVALGKQMFRVQHGREIIIETSSLDLAVNRFNAITTKPEETVKLDN